MKIITQVIIGYLLVLGVAGYLLVSGAVDEVKPAMRQSAEETLVDTANILAELVRADVIANRFPGDGFIAQMRSYEDRRFNATIYGLGKERPSLHIYVTDSRGIVLFDSRGLAVGEDYSRWNDVYLTLRGRYGARSSRSDPTDEFSTVMYVAAPIRDGDRIAGVLSVGKQNASVQPFIDRSENRIALGGTITVIGAGLLAMVLSIWLSGSVSKLVRYAQDVRDGRRAVVPRLRGRELNELGAALEEMRSRLEGKDYVEHYAEALTHELKSPLAAIRASAELVADGVSNTDRERFVENIQGEARRMQQIIERLLRLAMVESRQSLRETSAVRLRELVASLINAQDARIRERRYQVENGISEDAVVAGEHFLLRQAIDNLLVNALDFTPVGGRITFGSRILTDGIELTCHNSGSHIPEFALRRVGERFYSLPRPDTGNKSSGLGLSLVREVAHLHRGRLEVANEPAGGVTATLVLPFAAAA